MESPHSEKMETRYSTPVSDLDDHRDQNADQGENTQRPSRQGTVNRRDTGATMQYQNMDLLQVNANLREAGSIPRDFSESAIIDEENENEQALLPGLAAQRGGSRRIHEPMNNDRSRDRSASSSRSTSPPNSVDAFANPRRRERANTMLSKNPSELELNRTVSGGTHRRRPTFDNGSVRPLEINESASERAEEDVCYQQPDVPTKTFIIDYEEMEEFVAESRRGRPQTLKETRQRHSFSSQAKAPTLKGSEKLPTIIEPRNGSPTITETVTPDFDFKEEKNGSILDANFGPIRQPSVLETNRFSFFSSEIEQTIHAPEIGDLIMPGESFRDLFELPPESGTWWLDVMNPTVAELEMFQKAFGIHRLTTEDIEGQEIREKVELFNQYYFVCFRSFYQMDKNSEEYLDPVNLYMIVFREGILTFTYTSSPHAANVRKRIGKLRNYINLTADWICYAMVDDIVDSFGPVIHEIEIETDVIEDRVFVTRPEDVSSLLRQIGECRRKVMALMRLLGGKADVIKGFAKRCNEQYRVTPRGEIGLYLGDIQDHVVTMMSNLGHFEKMLSRSHSNYLAQLSVDNIEQGNRANAVLSKITIIATILVPLNMICGLFGMNVPVPGRESTDLTWFFGIVGFIFAIIVTSLVVAKRMRFI